MRNVWITVLTASVFAGCATHPQQVKNEIKVRIWPPSNPVTDEITVVVLPDGSFEEEVQKGRSSVKIVGSIRPAENGRTEIAFDYLHTIEEGRTMSLRAATKVYPGRDYLVDVLVMKDQDGHSHPIGPGGVVVELISPEE